MIPSKDLSKNYTFDILFFWKQIRQRLVSLPYHIEILIFILQTHQ